MISVIIAAYNYGQYIPDAVHSLQLQSYSDWECIIIDDGSTDNTREIVQQLCENEPRLNYVPQLNSGPATARNHGIKLAKGDYILFLDADDKLQKNKLKSHLDAFNKDHSLDIVYGDVRYFYEGKEEELFYSMRADNKPWTTKYSGKGNGLINDILKRNVMVTSSPLIKLAVFDVINGFDPVIHKLEDWDLFQRFAFADLKFQRCDDPDSFVLMRAHPGSFSYNKIGMRRYFLPLLEKIFFTNKLSVTNQIYVFIRMAEEYTDTILLCPFGKLLSSIHYFKWLAFVLPIVSIFFFPIYVIIKFIRFLLPAN